MALENEVVLTKMKLLNNFHEQLPNAEDSVSTVSMSVSEQDVSAAAQAEEAISINSAPEPHTAELKKNYLSVMFANSQLPGLYKFESEDSGVEMPSGANSPSTPTGSEHSFVVHSRESSCDSGNQDSHVEADDPLHLLKQNTSLLKTEQITRMDMENSIQTVLELCQEDKMDNILLNAAGDKECRTFGDSSEVFQEAVFCVETVEVRAESEVEPNAESRSHAMEAYDGKMVLELQPLRKSTTSDSLDEYMEECCRLSEVTKAIFYICLDF